MTRPIKERVFAPEEYLLEDIHAHIIDHGISFATIARRMGCSRGNITNLFARNRNPHIKRVMRLAAIVGLKLILVEARQ